MGMGMEICWYTPEQHIQVNGAHFGVGALGGAGASPGLSSPLTMCTQCTVSQATKVKMVLETQLWALRAF